MIYNTKKHVCYINSNLLYFILSGEMCHSRRIVDSLKDGIGELANLDLINILDVDNNCGFLLDCSALHINNVGESKEPYTKIDSSEVFKIINCDYRYKFKILRYFCYLTTTFLKNKKDSSRYYPVGFQTIDYMEDNISIDDNALMKYNNYLQKLELIYVYKASDVFIDSDGKVSTIPNTYGRYADKTQIIKAGQNHETLYGFEHQTKINKANGNKTRSASQKYNAFCSGKEYPEEELKDIYLILKEFNERQTDEGNKKDLSVFSQYKFYDSA